MTRTREKTVTFQEPFLLTGVGRELPAGQYRVTTDEELVEGLSFPVYRRTATMIFVPAQAPRGTVEMIVVDPIELVIAQQKDAKASDPSAAKGAKE